MKRETVPQRLILVLGDSMADWLAYGLEDAYSEQPDIGVIRKHKTVSGLIRYQPKGEPTDWVAAARSILATEKVDVIVVMLGLSDRITMHEPAPEKVDLKSAPDRKVDSKVENDAASKPEANPRVAPPDKPPDYELSGGLPAPSSQSLRRLNARARRTASTSFVTSGGSMSNEPKIQELIAVYAMISGMRVGCSPRTIECAEKVMRATTDAYAAPNKTISQLHEMLKSGAAARWTVNSRLACRS